MSYTHNHNFKTASFEGREESIAKILHEKNIIQIKILDIQKIKKNTHRQDGSNVLNNVDKKNKIKNERWLEVRIDGKSKQAY